MSAPNDEDSSVSDVDQRERAESALRDQSSLLEAIMDGASEAIFAKDAAGRFIAMNQAGARMFGKTVEEMVGHTTEEVFPPALAARFRKNDEALMATGVGRRDEESGVVDGKTRVFLANKTPLRDRNGKIVGVIGISADITERKQMEESLRESERRLATILDSLPSFIYLKDLEGRYLFANQAVCRLFGVSAEDLVGRDDSRYFDEDSLARIRAVDRDVLETGKALTLEEQSHALGATGVATYLSVKLPLRNEAGEIYALCGISTDITERKRVEAENEKLAARNRRLEKSESLGRMAGAVAHHFNNQLHALMMNLEIAMADLPQDGGPFEVVAEAWQSARRASEVSSQMLAYVGHSRGKRDLVDLCESLREHASALASCVPHGVALETDLPAPGPSVRCSPTDVQRVLTNLVSNAGEASAEQHGAVRVRVSAVSASEISPVNRFPVDWRAEEERYACIEVADSGPGIPPDDLESLFDPFFSTKFVGRGLGLPVALGVVRAHEGAITVETSPDGGSVFRVYLPAADEVVQRKSVPGLRAPISTAGGTVLLVDDEPGVRRAVGRALERAGFTVLMADDGVEAVELFRKHHREIDCVLSDVSMPRMDGWQTLNAVHQLAPGFPVILASGYTEAQVMEGAHPELPVAFLSKPYQTEQLLHTVSEVLANRSK